MSNSYTITDDPDIWKSETSDELSEEISKQQRHTRHCYYADPAYGKGVAEALGISLEEALRAEDPAHPSWDPRK